MRVSVSSCLEGTVLAKGLVRTFFYVRKMFIVNPF
jgi:hypothetical protein